MRWVAWLSLFLMFAFPVAILAVFFAGLKSCEADLHLRDGRRLYKEGKLAEAVPLLRRGLRERRDDLDGHRDYQDAMRTLGKGDQLPAEYNSILVRHPKQAWAHFLKARVSDRESLRTGMNKALELDPGFAPAHLALAHQLMDEKQTAEAMVHFERVLTGNLGVDDVRRYVSACYSEKKYESIDRTLDEFRQFNWSGGPPVLTIPLGEAAGRSVIVHSAREALSIQFIHRDRSYRVISYGRTRDGYAVAWTGDWEPIVADPELKVGEQIERGNVRPTFRELHDKALAFLGPLENKD